MFFPFLLVMCVLTSHLEKIVCSEFSCIRTVFGISFPFLVVGRRPLLLVRRLANVRQRRGLFSEGSAVRREGSVAESKRRREKEGSWDGMELQSGWYSKSKNSSMS